MPRRKTSIQTLRDSARHMALERAKSEALFHSIGDGAIATDENGKIERINRVALSLLGFEEDEVLGQWFPRLLVAEDSEEQTMPIIDRPISQAFLTGKPCSAKLFYRRKDGSRFPAAVTVAPVMLDGRPIGAIEVFRDITQDYEIDKIKDEFISIASHQLRTPATGVKQYVGMLIEGFAGELTERQRQMLNNAYESNERQLRIVDDLLRVAHLDAGKIQLDHKSVDLVEILKDVIKEQAIKLKNNDQNVVFRHPRGKVMIRIDAPRMRMVLENLLDNAGKYSPQNTTIQIEIIKKPRYVVINVRDEGVGINKGEQEKLFKKFSRLNNPLSHLVSGSGLGLYWAKNIIDLHGGKISVTSYAGKGSTFSVEIPLT